LLAAGGIERDDVSVAAADDDQAGTDAWTRREIDFRIGLPALAAIGGVQRNDLAVTSRGEHRAAVPSDT